MADKERALLTRREVSEEFGIAEKTLANWACAGTGPPMVKWGRGSVRYRRRDTEAWLDAHTVDPGHPDGRPAA